MTIVSTLCGIVVICTSLPPASWAQMRWVNISNPRALCNDFTRAGFFQESYPRSTKWIVVLESGGLCFSSETCNKRFFHPSIQSKYLKQETKVSVTGNSDPDKEFDAVEAWRSSQGKDLASVISPLMSSIHRYRNDQTLFPKGLVVNGRDLLDRDCKENPLFCHHNHVVLPYCSSDLWLGNDTRDLGPENEENFFAHQYEPDTSELQFVFRGAEIFRSAIIDLLNFGLDEATELVLLGSSAGGIGVINHVRWLQGLFRGSAMKVDISIIIDSAWFINFNGDIAKEFRGFFHIDSEDSEVSFSIQGGVNSTMSSGNSEQATESKAEFFDIISWQDACSDLRDGVPCCILAHCLLSSDEYYPSDVPLFSINSLYDMFLLSASLRDLVAVASQEQSLQPGYALEFLRIVAEYGGQMNSSVIAIGKELRLASFYITGCFQHIYLATSTLWGEPGMSLFGNGLVEVGNDIGVVRHSIQSNTWTNFHLTNATQELSIRDALQMWYQNKYTMNTSFVFRDSCQGSHCNDACPEMFLLGELNHNIWSSSVHVFLSLLVGGTAVLCIVLKVTFALWLCGMEWKQKQYLDQLGSESITYLETALQFPSSTDDDAISVSCLDLGYSVTSMTNTSRRKEDVTESSLLLMDEHSAKATLDTLSVSFGSEDGSIEPSGVYEPSIEGVETKSAPNHISRTPAHRYERLKRAHILQASYKNTHENEGVGYKLRRFANQTLNLPFSISHSTPGTSSFGSSHTASDRALSSTQQPLQAPVNSIQATPVTSYHSSCSKCVEDLDADDQPINEAEEMYSGESNDGENMEAVKEVPSTSVTKRLKREKVILEGISLYFNPGELIGIMGPSGCGKTTFLDLLTGRRHKGTMQGQIFVNGIIMEEVRDWYVANTGYVLQLATPYFEELTVRENLTLAAQIKLSKNYSQYEKFERVEQVMIVTGLLEFADTVVGGATGPGLSGGQKRRLLIALQLLKLPNVIFLDEPTSGLDAASSFELLSHLNKLADSNRTVILTIHQPRLEIFHMFHRLVLLSDGKVAYHGVPEKAYEVFVTALKAHYLERGLVIPELEDQNPADVLMDILGNSTLRQIITEYYQSSDEPKFVRNAIIAAAIVDGPAVKTMKQQFHYALFGARRVHDKHAGIFHRLAGQEARASKRSSYSQMAYLPLVFFIYGLLLGTVYFQQTVPLLVMSGFCVYSVASALFMFPILYNNLFTALEVYRYEHGDGIGHAADLIIQGFIRAVSLAFFPVVVCAGILYLLLVNSKSYDFLTFVQVVVVNISLNQAWISLLIALICAFPSKAVRLSPVISSVAGFTSGFFIPIHDMHWGYRWLFYINPNYYGFSASSFLLLRNFNTGCKSSSFDCYTSSGVYILQQFGFDAVNPYLHILILQLSVLFFLLLAVASNWLHHAKLHIEIRRVRNVIRKSSMAVSIEDSEDSQEEYEGSNSASRKVSGTTDDEIRSYDLDLWNSPLCLRRNLVAPTFQVESQTSQESHDQLEPRDEGEGAEIALEESCGREGSDHENSSGDQDSLKGDSHKGERFLSPIMEELSDVPSDSCNSIEHPAAENGETSHAQSTCSDLEPVAPPALENPDDLTFTEEEKPTKEDTISSFSNPDEDKVSLHSLSINDQGPSGHPSPINKHQAHSSVQLIIMETASDSEKTPEPKRKDFFTSEMTHVGQEESPSKSPRAQPKKRILRKESEYLREGEQHCVWKPGTTTTRSSLHRFPTEIEVLSKDVKATKQHLLERKRSFDMQIITAQEALRSKYSGSLSANSSPRITFRAAVDKVSANLRARKQNDQQVQFQDATAAEEQIKHQKALYSSRRRGSKASVKRLSPYSSPKMRHRSRHSSSTSHGSTSDDTPKFKSLNNSPERWWKIHRRSTSSPSMPFIFSGMNRPHHVSPLTTPTINSSDVHVIKKKSSPYKTFLRHQASAKFPPFISPQRHRRRQSQQLPSPARSIVNHLSPNFTDVLSISSPCRVLNAGRDKDNEKAAAATSVIPLAPQKSFSPSKSGNQIQLQHPLEKVSAAGSPLGLRYPAHDASGSIHKGGSSQGNHGASESTSVSCPPGVSPLQQAKSFPLRGSTTRKRSLSDGDA